MIMVMGLPSHTPLSCSRRYFHMSCRVNSLNFQMFTLWQADLIHSTYREFLSCNLKL
jgi:hypothetical protein